MIQVKRLTDEAYANAKMILKKHEDKLHLLAKLLIEQETLTGEIRKCIGLAEPVDKKPPQSLDDRKAAALAQKKSPLSAASS
jgi:cell division protease FtsH